MDWILAYAAWAVIITAVNVGIVWLVRSDARSGWNGGHLFTFAMLLALNLLVAACVVHEVKDYRTRNAVHEVRQ